MDFVGGSDGSREPELLKGSSSSSSSSHHHHHRLLQLGGGWGGGNCSISPQIYDHQRRERERERELVDFDFRRVNHHLQVVESDGGEGDRDRDRTAVEEEMREHMFDKVVTPSDVGKLNRLVIPKQHAERYFPLDSSNNDKGLLLNFEDRSGKSWRFRYSYWNSSQSYVMTKGWSRFVKDKKLDAGDIVSFHRSPASRDRLFIDWRRRPFHQNPAPQNHHHNNFSWSPLLMRPPNLPITLPHYLQQQQQQQTSTHHHHSSNNYMMMSSSYHPYRYGYGSVIAGPERPNSKYPYYSNNAMAVTTNRSTSTMDEELVRAAPGAGKRLMRLFGVNMECSGGGDEVEDEQQHNLQLRLYNGDDDDDKNKGKAISNPNSNSNSNPNPMSLDLDLDM